MKGMKGIGKNKKAKRLKGREGNQGAVAGA
jgi:hypothetical protein